MPCRLKKTSIHYSNMFFFVKKCSTVTSINQFMLLIRILSLNKLKALSRQLRKQTKFSIYASKRVCAKRKLPYNYPENT